MTWNPEEEGLTHINAYSKSNTALGRALSNFAKTPFTCEHGDFNSIEGYWYWLSCPPGEREELRHLYGYKAKQRGRVLRGNDWPQDETFRSRIRSAITAKIQQHPDIRQMLVESDLPIVHYYNYGGKICVPADGQWIWDHIMELRTQIQEQTNLIMITGHRPSKLGGYQANPTQTWVKNKLRQTLGEAKAKWPDVEIISGMALGVDQWWCEAALELGLPYHAYIPFEGQESRWPQSSRNHWQYLVNNAASQTIVCPGGYAPWKMQRRNEAMVDTATHHVAVWNGDTRGGTYNCVRYITSKDLPLYVINPVSKKRYYHN